MKTQYKSLKHFTLLSCLTLMLSACTMDMVSDVNLPDIKAKLVVSNFITPGDSLIRVFVSLSHPINKVIDYREIKDASVTISSDAGSIDLPYDSTLWSYLIPTATYPILPGKTYNLTVSLPGYATVYASTTMPTEACQDITFLGITKIYDNNRQIFVDSYNFKIKDILGQSNFYWVRFALLHSFDTNSWYYSLPNDNDGWSDDKDNDGGYINYSFINDNPDDTSTNGSFWLYTTDENYYLFHKTFFNNNNYGSDPFSEPVLVHTNVTNGLGAMGSYLVYKKDISLK